MTLQSVPTTLGGMREVQAAITAIGLPAPDQNALQAIQRNCREDFLSHLKACVASQDVSGTHRKAIEGLLNCLSLETGEAVRSLGFVPTFNTLASVGNRQPTRFLSAIAAARDIRHPSHAPAKTYLATVFAPPAQAPEAPPVRPAGPPAPAVEAPPRPSREAPQALNRPPPSPGVPPAKPGDAAFPVPAQPPGELQQRQYDSRHVYGSGYALCFNAGEWKGSAGVMVDAAVANGTENYDWQGAVHIWLDVREVAAVLAVFRKRRPSVEFAAHGAQNDKSFSIAFQGGHYYAKVAARNRGVRGVKMLPTDATAVSVLFLRQLGRAYPDIPLETVLDLAMTINESGCVRPAASA